MLLLSWLYDALFAPHIHMVTRSASVLVCADIGSWLQLFGFQLHNVVPGFSKPEVGRLEQTYELMKTQTQNWDSSKVSFLFCSFFGFCFVL